MWHHLRARIDNIRLRVLHPIIQEHQTVDILRGLPEGSRLSPTLFGIFVADLIHELQTKFCTLLLIMHLVYNTNLIWTVTSHGLPPTTHMYRFVEYIRKIHLLNSNL